MPSLAMVFDILAVDRASGVFDRVGGSAAKAGRDVEASSGRMSTAMAAVAKGTALAGAAFAVVSVKMAADFQTSVTKLATTAGESTKNLKMVGDGMLQMAGQVGISATELAKGMYTVESSGIHGADTLKVLKAAAQGAKQEQADLSKVTDAVTTALHDYNMPASMAATVTSQMVTAVSAGKTTFDELTGSLHSVTPLAAALHVPFADIIGSLAAMTASGESADQATQNMADALRHLQAPTQPMIDELAQLGITASDLGKDLGSKGLSGTIQEVSQAILAHMGPSGQVLLGTFNQSKIAAADAAKMYANLPPELQKVAKAYESGSMTVQDWRGAVKGMPADQQTLAVSWKNMQDKANGFSAALKSGKPDAQEYTAALQKAMGTSAGLTVALQLTGEHTDAVNASIRNIAKSTGDAAGNIKGWGEVQGNFNQQLDEFLHGAGALAIQFGQHLLPVLTDTFGYLNRDALPAVKSIGGAVGDAAHWFSQLPGPVKAVAEAMAGLALANAVGLFAKLGTGIVYARVVMAEFAASTTASMGAVSVAYREAATQAAFLATVQGRTAAVGMTSALAGMGAAAGAAAKGGLSALKSAGSGLINMLGGPWVVGIGAAVGAVLLWKKGIDDHNAAVKADTEQVTAWYKAMSAGGQGAIDASQKLKSKQQELAAAQAELNRQQDVSAARMGSAGRASGAVTAGLTVQKQKVSDLTGEVAKGKKQWDDYWNSLTPQGKIAQTVAGDEADLALALQGHAAGSKEVMAASAKYNADLEKQKQLSVALSGAEQTQIDKLNQLAASQLAGVSSSLAATQAQSQLSDAIGQYNTDAGDGQHSTKALADESNSLAQQAISTAQAVGKATADQIAATGAQDDGTAANAAMLKSLQDAAKHIRGPGHDALEQAITDLGKTTVATGNVHDAVGKMGLQVEKTWDSNTVILGSATAQQIRDLKALGDKVSTLPNGKIVVTSNTKPATDEINKMLAYYRHQALTLQATLPSNGAIMGGGSARAGFANGGLIRGAGSGTSDSIPIMASNNEFIVNAAATQANLSLLHAINGGAIKGFAAGGLVGGNSMTVGTDSIATHMNTSGVGNQLAALIAHLKAALAPIVGIPSSVAANAAIVQRLAGAHGWGSGSEWDALRAVVMRESGFRNTAQNPTSTAYGMFQFLDSTWGAYGATKTSNPAAQAVAGLGYIGQRYGDPLGAYRHEQQFGWYRDGTNWVPNDGPAYLHRGEAVVPAAKNQGAPYQSGPITIQLDGQATTALLEGKIVEYATAVDHRSRY